MVIETLSSGGAELFVLRLASGLKAHGIESAVFVGHPDRVDTAQWARLAPDIPIFPGDAAPWFHQARRFDWFFEKRGLASDILHLLQKPRLEEAIRHFRPTILHSHLAKSDYLGLEAARGFHLPVVTTIHGDYLNFNTRPGMSPHLLRRFDNSLARMSHIVCISEQQAAFLQKRSLSKEGGDFSKIYNGYTVPSSPAEAPRPCIPGWKPGDFVFGMVSRGIEEKGWKLALEAFQGLQTSLRSHLVLVGGGAYMEALAREYSHVEGVHFVGHSACVLDWIETFDVGLLPSYYRSESLPTVVIEYLASRIPVIASDIGEVARMLEVEERSAGIVLPMEGGGQVAVPALRDAMKTLMSNSELRHEMAGAANEAFKKFSMPACVEAYSQVYDRVRTAVR